MKKLRFLISLIMPENHYQKLHAASARVTAQRLGVDIEVVFANNDAIAQSEQLLNAIQSSKESRFDGVICAPVGTTLVQVARHAASAGIGWAILNRECEYSDELRRKFQVPVFSVCPDQEEIGRIQANQIKALLPEGGLILYILGPTVSTISEIRSRAMNAAKPANVQVRTLVGNFSEQSGYSAVSKWLQLSTSTSTPVKLVAGQNDDMAMGAKKAFEALTNGADRFRWLSLPYIGVDCCPEAGQKWVQSGLLKASVVNPPTAGIALETMVRSLRGGGPAPERTLVRPHSYPSIEQLSPAAPAKPAHGLELDKRPGAVQPVK
jgi:ribose transport system substrate-binding protein